MGSHEQTLVIPAYVAVIVCAGVCYETTINTFQ